MVMRVVPTELRDVISVTPAIVPRLRSSGIATDDAMTSGLAPGIFAVTEMMGTSSWGSGATDNSECPSHPARTTATHTSVVATGRTMKTPEMLTGASPARRIHGARASGQNKDK